ncbi:MAG: bile acid:sodium symporter family protein [Nocardioides sp.]|uniref:bile acid:sodium symporter family protein n=1 Tax=Nocardioides sp. TaxID=35761 RepID=UPI003EFF2B55
MLDPMLVLGAASDLDTLSVDLPAGSSVVIKVVIAFFLFGIALEAKPSDFLGHLKRPWVLGVGVLGQFLVLPALTLLMAHLLDVPGSVALGMLLVACLPAGNLSNLLTHRARGDVALSVAMTTASNLVALVATPALFAFWASRYAPADALLARISLDPVAMAVEIGLLIGVPFAAGVYAGHRWPVLAARSRRFVDAAVLVLLLLVVVGSAASGAVEFLSWVDDLIWIVVLQNAMVLLVGWLFARGLRLPPAGTRAMVLELGIRNTGLGIVIAVAYFGEVGGAVLVMALWALWDVLSGLLLATFWRRRPLPVPVEEPA